MPASTRKASPPEQFTSIQAGAAAYGVHPDTLRRRVRDGSLPAYRNGRLIRIKVCDLDALFRPVRSDIAQAG